ncbi:MAG TPA: MarR family transcriptional regulator [Saprospiraceae bacterium]|nr:MarR family transcriptional regulator [Saprospiraceae bacterium]
MLKLRKEESIILRIINLAEQLKRRRDRISQDLGISTQQWLILLHLAFDPNIPFLERYPQKKPLLASELAESLDVTRPNITAITNVLLDKGLITQTDDDIDKRRKRLTLTQKGWDLLKDLQVPREKLNSELFSKFEEVELNAFLKYLSKCMEILEQDMY